MRILIAEDEADIRDLMQIMLMDAGHEVALAGTVSSAAQMLQGGTYDLMLTDMIMPDGNGIQLAHAARARGMAAVLCTGYPREDDTLSDAGIDFLQKPFTMQALLRKVAAAA